MRREKLTISIDSNTYFFLKLASALTKKDMSDIIELGVRLVKHYTEAGAAADEFLAFIEKRDPQLLEELVEFRNRLEEAKARAAGVVA